MVVVMMVVVVDDHLLVLFHLPGWHLILLFLRNGRDGEAERNEGRQGNSKLVHRFLLVEELTTDSL